MAERGLDSSVTPIAGHAATLADYDLVRRVRARDEVALEALYERYGGLVFTLALRIVGERDLANEVMQDVFFRCWRGPDLYDPARGALAGWLMGLTRNRAIDLLRGRQHQARLREREPSPATGDDGPIQPDASDAIVLRQVVCAALEGLPSGQRQVLTLAYFGGLTQVEIAQRLQVPLGTVKTRTRDGMERLRQELRPVMETGAGTHD